MDWTTFFKDNSQSLFALGGVFLGSLITFLINYLNLRYQSKERDKDREEQRREAKIQVKEKWIERDILQMMDSVEKLITLRSEAKMLGLRVEFLPEIEESGLLTDDELSTERKSNFEKHHSLYTEIHRTSDRINMLVHSFGDIEIVMRCGELWDAMSRYSNENETANWTAIGEKAGGLQKVLREKLISIRDT